jgi:alginate O-acetyltransferase complex protein AlgJ
MAQFSTIEKLPAPELHAWALDFPQPDVAARIGERGLYLQGWVLAGPDAVRGDLLVRSDGGDAGRIETLPFNNPRPDVIQRVLGVAPDGHAQLRCGFIAHLKDVPAAFTLGVMLDGAPCWLYKVTLDGSAEPPPQAAAAQVIEGADGWLYLDNDTNRSVDQFTGSLTLDDDGVGRWQAYLDSCAGMAGAAQACHAIVIAASKEQVLPEHYPHVRGSLTVHEQVLQRCRPGHRVLDTAALLAAREDRAACFMRTDTHWTDRGAMLATLALAGRLGLDAEAVRARFAEDVYYTMPFAGDLGVKLTPALSAPTEFLQAPPAASGAAFDNGLPNIGRVLVFEDGAALCDAGMLMFGASSSYPMLKYLKRLLRRIVFVHSAGNVDPGLVRHEQPDYLVMQTTARFMIEPPDTGFDLGAAVAQKIRNADASIVARALAAAHDAAADPRNAPYLRMLQPE